MINAFKFHFGDPHPRKPVAAAFWLFIFIISMRLNASKNVTRCVTRVCENCDKSLMERVDGEGSCVGLWKRHRYAVWHKARETETHKKRENHIIWGYVQCIICLNWMQIWARGGWVSVAEKSEKAEKGAKNRQKHQARAKKKWKLIIYNHNKICRFIGVRYLCGLELRSLSPCFFPKIIYSCI